jgi:hypothetical protein
VREPLDDLVAFARVEVDSGDLEPWAEIVRELHVIGALGVEATYWVVKLYNGFDSLGSALRAYERWSSVNDWRGDRAPAVLDLPLTQERRGLRGGKIRRHLDDYAGHLGPDTQREWIRGALGRVSAEEDWLRLEAQLRGIYGVGRQTAFEWAEFLAKCLGVDVSAPDARLWESEGPRRALQRLYGEPNPSAAWLNERAEECRAHLAAAGVELAWVDFETVICDFNVMRDGRYYPGRHLAALREEIVEAPESFQEALSEAWERVVSPRWQTIKPGIQKALLPVYRDTGEMVEGCDG